MVKNPVISVNRLGEYLICRAARQRDLIRQRKFPDPDVNVLGMYYREATDAIQKYIAEGCADGQIIANALNHLQQMPAEKIGTRRRIDSNIDRLESFEEMLDDLDLQNSNTELGFRSGRMKVCGVDVSVRPEIILRGVGKKGRKLVGAIKLQMSVATKFNAEAAGYVSAVVQEFCKRSVALDDEIVYAPYCQVIDVGGEVIHPGVKSIVRRMKDVEAGCRNIAGLWPTVDKT